MSGVDQIEYFAGFGWYDAAMLSFTSYTKANLHVAILIGFLTDMVSMLIAVVYLILKLIYWEDMR